ncbi:MAG: DUF6364 family protein [Myxococcota bacterium]
MRTTISIDEALLKRAKAFAAETDRTLSDFVQDAVRESLARTESRPQQERIKLPVVQGKRRPGVDYESFAELHEITERS